MSDSWRTVDLDYRLQYWLTEYEHSVTMEKYWRSQYFKNAYHSPLIKARQSRHISEYQDRQRFAFYEIMYLWQERLTKR